MGKTKYITKNTIANFKLVCKCFSKELRFYFYVKLFALNNNSQFPSLSDFMKDLGWSKSTTIRIIQNLEDKKHLKVIRKSGLNNVYDISWYDKINSDTEKKGWNFQEELRKMANDKKRHIQIIALYWTEKNWDFKNEEQFKNNLKRELRPATKLVGYTDEEIKSTIQAIKNTDYIQKYTLETISKFIPEIANQKKKEPKIIKWQEVKKPDGTIYMKAIKEKKQLSPKNS